MLSTPACVSSIQSRLTACTGFLYVQELTSNLVFLSTNVCMATLLRILVEMFQSKFEVPALRRLRSTARGDLVVP